jgi:hypothetical protein
MVCSDYPTLFGFFFWQFLDQGLGDTSQINGFLKCSSHSELESYAILGLEAFQCCAFI